MGLRVDEQLEGLVGRGGDAVKYRRKIELANRHNRHGRIARLNHIYFNARTSTGKA